jgi:hypothetical protein
MLSIESNPLAPKPTEPKAPKKSEAELIDAFFGKKAKEAFEKLQEGKRPLPSEEPLPPRGLTEEEKRFLKEQKLRELMKTHVRLKNIPHWDELPDAEKLKKDFKFDYVWDSEYRPGRPMTDFENPNNTEAEPIAKVFDIGDVIRKKKSEDPNHPDSLTTQEVLDAIDEEGYRPATLEELVAYSRDYWKPDADPKTLTEEERVLQNAQAPHMYGLNSVFSDADGRRYVPSLDWGGDERDLYAILLENDWSASSRFLVLRKASSIKED